MKEKVQKQFRAYLISETKRYRGRLLNGNAIKHFKILGMEILQQLMKYQINTRLGIEN